MINYISARALFIFFAAIFITNVAKCQFWVGPKIGGQITTHKYADDQYEDLYTVEKDFNMHFGLAFEYTTEGHFAAHVDLIYQKVTNTLKNNPDAVNVDNVPIINGVSLEANYHYISTPILLKAVFGVSPFTYYVNFGPTVSYWLKGNGKYFEDELEEFLIESPVSYDVVFGSSIDESATAFTSRNVQRPTRLQWGFTAGGGVQFDVNSNQRIQVDLRYTFGHSNMGFNVEENNPFFQQNVEFSNRMVVFSVAYLFGYDPSAKRKGASNSRLGK